MGARAATNRGSTTADKETNCRSRGKEGGPSLNSLALMRKATTPTDISSVDIKDWRCVVYEGVLLENNTQKFWVDEKFHKNCFLVLPNVCDIAGGDKDRCWSWITEKENCAVDILVPEMEELSWFLIQGRFKTIALSPNTMYEVAFMVKLIGTDYRWQSPVELELDLPDGTKQTGTEILTRMPVNEWMKLCAGEFMMGPETVGTICFTLHGTFDDTEKGGLILKGVFIHPKDTAKHNQFDAVELEFV